MKATMNFHGCNVYEWFMQHLVIVYLHFPMFSIFRCTQFSVVLNFPLHSNFRVLNIPVLKIPLLNIPCTHFSMYSKFLSPIFLSSIFRVLNFPCTQLSCTQFSVLIFPSSNFLYSIFPLPGQSEGRRVAG